MKTETRQYRLPWGIIGYFEGGKVYINRESAGNTAQKIVLSEGASVTITNSYHDDGTPIDSVIAIDTAKIKDFKGFLIYEG